MSSVKYVAEGFVKDSEKLIHDFIKDNSTNFTVFTTKWKEHNFGLIFLGRDKLELTQFINEIYQLSLEYLQNTSFILQVGAVYLLYALFRNQPIDPPIRIRLTLQQWVVIRKLKVLAEKNCYLHLDYVITFLYANSFDRILYPMLHGPLTSIGRLASEKPAVHTTYLLKDCKTDMCNFQSSNLLKEIRDLGKEYKKIQARVLSSRDKEIISGSDLDEYIDCLDVIMRDGPYYRKKLRNKSGDPNLGSRRARIKANQFEKKILFRQLNPSDSDEDNESATEVKEKKVERRTRKRRLSKNKRRVGRPRKFDLEKLIESDGNEREYFKFRGCGRKRGPTSKSTYLDNYELNITSCSKLVKKDLFSSETSEEESLDSKESNNVQSDVVLNHSVEKVGNSSDQEVKSENQDCSEDQEDNSENQNCSEDQEDNSEDQEDNSDDQKSNKDIAMNDASDSNSDESNENFELYF